MTTKSASTPTTLVTATDWFAGGRRRPYDPTMKSILSDDHDDTLRVFERIEHAPKPGSDVRWTTLLPGFPDGSFGFARVNELLADTASPRLFVEYLGQGDSDKPKHYTYSTIERADLVEALWTAHGVTKALVVTFDYSSLVLLELLARQSERNQTGDKTGTDIDEVLIINGGLFADSHSHPWQTTPLLKTQAGRMSMFFTQRSRFMFVQIMRSAEMFSKEYRVSTSELHEEFDAIARRKGTSFVHRGAGFVDEHKANSERWDLRRLFDDLRTSVSFHLAGSVDDPYEPKQLVSARERLGPNGPGIIMFPGGHMTTSEHPDLMARLIDGFSLGSDESRVA